MSGHTSDAKRKMQMKSRRAFLTGGVAALIGWSSWKWLIGQDDEDGIPWPLRRVLRFNEKVGKLIYDDNKLAPTFSVPLGKKTRINGDLGLGENFDAGLWMLDVTPGVSGIPLQVPFSEIQSLPRTECAVELKCIEGWVDRNSYVGVSFYDFMKHYKLGTRSGQAPDTQHRSWDLFPYVGLETPDGKYYVSMDIESMLHPQTLLCYIINGKSLLPEQGAPLRLFTPVKYGIKSLKRIGRIWFSDLRPPDYWAERGYDWYSGL